MHIIAIAVRASAGRDSHRHHANNREKTEVITAVTEFTVAAPAQGAFEDHFTASMHATLTDVPGLRNARLLRPRKGAHRYLAALDFEDDAAFTAYTSSEASRAAHADPTHSLSDDNGVMIFEAVMQV
ncbi:antibiotic biosynthesis monooxygenase family protein [Streptomyces pilosus]|uniref:Antibiotic biosynthesis monooxygenase n=1 Tax=Streptomyces pilosus TaxID=28893 RepID=A0A918C6D9_9ACTN|nr:antibiotic biosynthesis monooxygenase family protein [Streptomyces pilosus]GGR08216.1 antibiotic biosynthesis monooxygenase [Streptomyces pilosus]